MEGDSVCQFRHNQFAKAFAEEVGYPNHVVDAVRPAQRRVASPELVAVPAGVILAKADGLSFLLHNEVVDPAIS